MANPVLISDLEARFRPLAGTEIAQAQALLDDAWVILLSRRPSLDAEIGDGSVRPDLVRAIVAAMVVRVLRNPNGVRQWSVDDYSETRDNSVAAGSLYVSDDEMALLNGGASSEAFSIRPKGIVAAFPPDPWLPYVLP